MGIVTLKNHFSNKVELQTNHQLIQSGIYTIIRHPIYCGIILQAISTILLLNVRFAIIFVVWAIIGVLVRIKNEERSLSTNLTGYVEYRKKSSALFLGIY